MSDAHAPQALPTDDEDADRLRPFWDAHQDTVVWIFAAVLAALMLIIGYVMERGSTIALR